MPANFGHLMSEGKWWRFMAKAAWLRFWVTAASNLAAPKQSRYQMSFTSICKFKQLGSGNSAIHYTGWFKATPTLDDSNPKWNQLVWHVSLSMCGLPQTIPKKWLMLVSPILINFGVLREIYGNLPWNHGFSMIFLHAVHMVTLPPPNLPQLVDRGLGSSRLQDGLKGNKRVMTKTCHDPYIIQCDILI